MVSPNQAGKISIEDRTTLGSRDVKMSVLCQTKRNSLSVLSVFLSSQNLIVSIGVDRSTKDRDKLRSVNSLFLWDKIRYFAGGPTSYGLNVLSVRSRSDRHAMLLGRALADERLSVFSLYSEF
jgi:hypothetical protein